VTPYQQVLNIARAQSAALGRGDLEVATALLDERAAVLAGAPVPAQVSTNHAP